MKIQRVSFTTQENPSSTHTHRPTLNFCHAAVIVVCVGKYVRSCIPSAPSGHEPCVYLYDNKTIGVSILCVIPLCKLFVSVN